MKKNRLLTGIVAAAVSVSMLAAPAMAQAATPVTVDEKNYYMEDSGWLLISDQTYTYSNKGYIKKNTYKSYDNDGSVEYTLLTSYAYDKKNRLKKSVYTNSSDKTVKNTNKYSYGNNKTTIRFYDYKGKYNGKDVTKYTFYSNKTVKKSTSCFYNNKNNAINDKR